VSRRTQVAGPLWPSTYHHVRSKDAIVDWMVDRAFAEIERPPADLIWKAGIGYHCLSARQALARHPRAAPL